MKLKACSDIIIAVSCLNITQQGGTREHEPSFFFFFFFFFLFSFIHLFDFLILLSPEGKS